MGLRDLAVVTGFISLLAGCAGNDMVVKKQMEMEARIEQLAQANVAANARLTTLTDEVKELQGQLKSASSDLEVIKPNVAGFKVSVETLQEQMAALNNPPTPTPKIEVVNRDAAPVDNDSAHQDTYMKAFGLFSANNYNAAIDAFEAFIQAYPQSEYVGNALYWVGECYYTQHDYNQALDAFSKVITTFPDGNKAPDAMLKIGYTLISINEVAKARESLQSLVDKYPKTQAAAKAREKLARLSK